MDQDGDFFEVAASSLGRFRAKRDLQIHCLNGPARQPLLVALRKKRHLPDNPEPSRTVRLSSRHAPSTHARIPNRKTLKDAICKSVTVKVAVSIEGPWTLMGATQDRKPMQASRRAVERSRIRKSGSKTDPSTAQASTSNTESYAYYGVAVTESAKPCPAT